MQKMNKIYCSLILTALFCIPSIKAQTDTNFIPGQTYFGSYNYSEYIAGNYPLIISSSHGGDLFPSIIPDRTWGTTTNDANTQELTRYLLNEIVSKKGRYPHVIINRLARIKMDANRDSVEAAQGNPYALKAWQDYHFFIEYAKAKVIQQHGKGLFIDIHGHGHTIQRIEIGYLLTSTDLSKTDAELNNNSYKNKSSIRDLGDKVNISFSQLIRGPLSLGTIFANIGYPAVPSSSDPSPGTAPYFNGGYNTQRYGSLLDGTIDAVQLEINKTGIRDSDQNTRNFAKKLEVILDTYLLLHYSGLLDNKNEKDNLYDFIVVQNYPNPFNPETKIKFQLPISHFNSGNLLVTLSIYDLLGNKIETLIDREVFMPGDYEYSFKADKYQLSSGIYFYCLRVNDYTINNKMLLLK